MNRAAGGSSFTNLKKIIAAAAVGLTLAGSTAAYAQHYFDFHRVGMNAEDRAAFADSRIAAVKAGLKLTPDQEKLWPVLETAVRDFAKLRIDRVNARAEARKRDEDSKAAAEPLARLQRQADEMATTAAGLKRIAEAADPLYKTLDDGQKRRLRVLTRGADRFGSKRLFDRGFRERRDRDDDRNRGGKKDRDSDRDAPSGRL